MGGQVKRWIPNACDMNSIDKQVDVLNDFLSCRGGEIGRHVGFKIPWPRGRAGSIPALGTSHCNTMNTKHKKTLRAIYHNPILASIVWSDVESLFAALGADVEEGKGSRVTITLNEEVAVFHRPHPRKETIRGAVKSVREFLDLAGVKQC